MNVITEGIWTTDVSEPQYTLGEPSVHHGLSTEAIIYIVIGIFGVLDNGFAVLVIGTNKKMRKKVCNFFILNQSIIDLAGSFFTVVNNPALVSQRMPEPHAWAEVYCRIWASSYPMWALVEMSTANLVAITVERYVEVVHPLSYPTIFSRRRAQITIACVWLFGIIFPSFANVWPSPPGNEGYCLRYGGWPNLALARFVGILFYLVLMIAPLIIMIYRYSRMVVAIKSRVGPVHGNLSAAEKARETRRAMARRNLIKTLIIVCVAFFVCWIMNQTYFFLLNVGVTVSLTSSFYYVTVYLAFLNSVINPIIYTAQYREFQQAAKDFLPCVKPAVPAEEVTDSTTM